MNEKEPENFYQFFRAWARETKKASENDPPFWKIALMICIQVPLFFWIFSLLFT